MAVKPKLEQYLQVPDIASALDCSIHHVYRLIEDGELDGIKLGKKAVRVSHTSYISFLESRNIKSSLAGVS